MPTYQYACTECDHAFEQAQRFTDDALTECPACQGRLRKIFNAVGVVFKGSGFYRTDSRSENGSRSTGSGDSGSTGSTESAGASSSTGSTESSASSGSTGSTKSSGSSGTGAAASTGSTSAA